MDKVPVKNASIEALEARKMRSKELWLGVGGD